MAFRLILIVFISFCATMAQEAWNDWDDALTVLNKLKVAKNTGHIFYSQFDFYPARKTDSLKSKYVDELNMHLLIYGLDLYYASGSYFPKQDIAVARKNLISIVKNAWKKNRAIPCFSWHLENPYVPSNFEKRMGCRYNYKVDGYPQTHRYVIKEILNNEGDSCGFGNWSRVDNVLGAKNPREWFIERVKEISQIFNELIDSEGHHIPFIFRPWHENNGDWMWWGPKSVSKQDFKAFFSYTENLVKKFAPDAQILWAYSPDRYFDNEQKFLSRYPGDEFVDLVGFDDYSIGSPQHSFEKSIERARIVSKIAEERGKVACLFETDNKNEHSSDVFFRDYIQKMIASKGVHLALIQLWSVGRFKTEQEINDRRTFLHQRNVIVVK